MERIPMTQEGYAKLKSELERLDSVEMPLVAERIAQARAEGDLKENAEYHGQRERQGMLQAKINLLRDKLSRAQIVDPSKLPKDEVAFGTTVRVKDLDLDDEEVFTLVGAGEEDYDSGKILITSPIGQGLLGKKVGDKVVIQVPKGVINFQIISLRNDLQQAATTLRPDSCAKDEFRMTKGFRIRNVDVTAQAAYVAKFSSFVLRHSFVIG